MDADTGIGGHKPITTQEAKEEKRHALQTSEEKQLAPQASEEKQLALQSSEEKQLALSEERQLALQSSEAAFNEKRESVQEHDHDLKSDTEESEEGGLTDLFVSLPPIKDVPVEENPLTVRAVVVGIILGSLCNASNVYLGKF